ncbi:N-acetylmannosamine-6-phosphate 2-epimerase [Listeria costaricensis]|uniref:N-acetylmannosamine-6-phosphate 2-epimerase n=1 Tax=Listeria costaricensis TaxID=2026604 RepID=UPI000C077D4B|nr:N-acetylmannosamine-6-phosphate 2-epimerase [Listeria costaricensis]
MLEKLAQGLIVSCQALENEPLHSSYIMSRMAVAAEMGGAAGIRANSVADINAIKQATSLPLIGIIKRDYPDSEIYITATAKEVQELLTTDAEIIALDATDRVRPHQEKTVDLVEMIHEANKLAMADISTFAEAKQAEADGFDMVSTTLSGYTAASGSHEAPDFELVKRIKAELGLPVILEGHVSEPAHVAEALQAGAYAVVVGSIITRPQLITQRYVAALEEAKESL